MLTEHCSCFCSPCLDFAYFRRYLFGTLLYGAEVMITFGSFGERQWSKLDICSHTPNDGFVSCLRYCMYLLAMLHLINILILPANLRYTCKPENSLTVHRALRFLIASLTTREIEAKFSFKTIVVCCLCCAELLSFSGLVFARNDANYCSIPELSQ